MTKRAALAALLLVLAAAPGARAHQAHSSPAPAAPTPAPSEAEDASPAPSPAEATEEDEAPADDPSMEVTGDLADQGALAAIPWRSAFTSHIHNKIVHFPLALGMAAAFLLIVAPRWPSYEPAARVLLIAGALASVIAYFSGEAQEDQFDDSPFHAVVELHFKFGITTAITLWTGVALTFWPRARRFMPVYGVILLLLLAATGFLGGVLSHS